jgi:hypothetical protein
MARCIAKTKSGSRCKANAMKGKALCLFHRKPSEMKMKRFIARNRPSRRYSRK